jgi:sterol-4alpha-carboxylate 3-dehydrogenase (decarboxylating)
MPEISKNILISGGTGFVGSAIARALAQKHPRCTITVIDASPPRTEHVLPKGTSCIQVDITSVEALREAFKAVSPDVVVHTAGIIPGLAERFRRRIEREAWKINVEGTRNMLDESMRADVEAFVYTSSCCVVTDDTNKSHPNIDEESPSSPRSTIYGETKVGITRCSVLSA